MKHIGTKLAMQFSESAQQIAPVYYVSGNHEYSVPMHYDALKSQMSERGVIILENESVTLERQGKTQLLIGVKQTV